MFRDKCCFCISLRTGTLLLAVLGTISHLYGALTLTALSNELSNVDSTTVFGLTLYSYLSGFTCLAGAIGVVKRNAKKLRLFSVFYWVDLGLHMLFSVASAFMLFSMRSEICQSVIEESTKEDRLDMEDCLSAFTASAWLVTIAMAINSLFKLHFAFAIRRYAIIVQREQEEEQACTTHVIAAPPAYGQHLEKKDVLFVAGKEVIPDQKQKESTEV